MLTFNAGLCLRLTLEGAVVRAVGLMVHGGPEVLEVIDLDEVTAGPGEVRIRNFAAAVNPTDIVARDGTRAKLQSQFHAALRSGYGRSGYC